jgi:hypothetical protein
MEYFMNLDGGSRSPDVLVKTVFMPYFVSGEQFYEK